ncbi:MULTISPECIES: acyltransferase family protein [Streptosporangium]|uniref:Fucose 4-O-acetylase-like acetyltransferase n=1 Tax=Streptosporangium brasiliense TaxID=47480 RepID=A0ABT9R0P3_9ACTN|nr:acyltransferase family protein [Streptosporangium brasiliense]MDP9862798.1 fucose 4-O-acetylase-like acetyltransferase [Streptosporangium brasiliense]
MSDTRSPFHMPAPRDDGAPDAGTGGSGGQGRTSASWPMPEHAQPSPASRASWPEPPDLGPAPSTRDGHREEQGWDEGAGEVTAWGYPAYQEPPTPSEDAWANWDTQTPPGEQEPTSRRDARASSGPRGRTPQRETPPSSPPQPRGSREDTRQGPAPQGWGSSEDLRPSEDLHPSSPPESWGSRGDTRQGSAPQGWGSSDDARRPSARETRTPYPDARTPARRSPLDITPATAPAGNLLDPLDPAWSSEHDTVRAPAAPHRPQPQDAPAAAERPFSYWENSSRGAAPSPWDRSAGPEEQEQEPRPEEEPAAPPARKKREPYLDNVKFVLIALVVTGHSLVPTLATHSAKSAYLFIYTFHMPAFVLISGYLGRNFWNSNAKINKLVDTMLVPYVVVEIGYALLRFGLGQKWTLTIIDPAWLNWYLLALVLWRISTPIWNRMRQPLLVAVIIYMVAGFSEISGDFSIDRFFGLLPFYVLGLVLKPEHFDLLKPVWVRILGGLTLAGGAAVAIFIAPHVNLKPIYFRYSFKSMDMSWWIGLGVRGALLVAALAMSVALLAVVPRRETWFSDLGTRTLYAYLLHGVVVLIAKDQGWLSFPWLYGPLGVMAIASSSLALAIVLSLPETRKLFKWLLEPRLVWLYRRPSAASPARSPEPAGTAPEAAGRESSAAVTR